jgi:ribonuclease P protein component
VPAKPRDYSFPRTHRLGGQAAFAAVFAAKIRDSRGPLTLYARPNDLPHPRLGISIGRKVGSAVQRNRIKRLLREAFRLMRYDLPRGYDLVVVVRPHPPALLADYQRLLLNLSLKVHQIWQRRAAAPAGEHPGLKDHAR